MTGSAIEGRITSGLAEAQLEHRCASGVGLRRWERCCREVLISRYESHFLLHGFEILILAIQESGINHIENAEFAPVSPLETIPTKMREVAVHLDAPRGVKQAFEMIDVGRNP